MTACFCKNLFKDVLIINNQNFQIEAKLADRDRSTGLIAATNRQQYIDAHST